jgi:hypothetical protein
LVVSEILPGFPQQNEGLSYGCERDSLSYRFFTEMTPGWIEHPHFGWVYSESGETGPGSWLWGPIGLFFVGSESVWGGMALV